MTLSDREQQVWLMCVGPPVILAHRNRDPESSTLVVSDDACTTRHDMVFSHEVPGTVEAAVRVFGLKLAIQTRMEAP